MQQLTFDAPAWLLPIIAIIAYIAARYLYRNTTNFDKKTRYLLLTLRSLLIFFLLLLLLGPILKLTNIENEKPIAAILVDRSASVWQSTDSIKNRNAIQAFMQTKNLIEAQGFIVKEYDIDSASLKSNLTQGITNIINREEGKIDHLIMASDGLYNEGISPLYKDFNFKITTIGLGDSTVKRDLIVKNLTYNKIAYQGNQFPLRAEISTKGFEEDEITVFVFQNGKRVSEQKVKTNPSALTPIDFILKAEKNGLQKIEVRVAEKEGEWNKNNNHQIAFVEVVSGKKKILILAQSPHPDIKALRSAIEENENYELDVLIDGLPNQNGDKKLNEADLIIFYQLPNTKGKSNWYARAQNTKASFFFVMGEQSNWTEIINLKLVSSETLPRQKDEAFASINTDYPNWQYSEDLTNNLEKWPPLSVPFFKYSIPPAASVLCYQQVGSVVTPKPLLWTEQTNDRKLAVLLGEGFWKWKLQEYNQTETHVLTNEFWSKLIQYLSTTEDKARFKCFPIVKEFQLNEIVVFETQIYNQLYEPIFGKEVDLQIKNEQNQIKTYQFTTSQGDSKFVIGSLPEGIYQYTATTKLEQEQSIKGEFFVSKSSIELSNTQADFNLLRNLSNQTGGKFFSSTQIESFKNDIKTWEAKGKLLSEDTYNPLINLFFIFMILLILVSSEWVIRKYHGSY